MSMPKWVIEVSMVNELTRLAMLRGLSIAIEDTATARTSNEVTAATGQFLNVTADLVDAISSALGIPSIRRVQRRADGDVSPDSGLTT
jgi:hypothetical protein